MKVIVIALMLVSHRGAVGNCCAIDGKSIIGLLWDGSPREGSNGGKEVEEKKKEKEWRGRRKKRMRRDEGMKRS